jgi:hypothetical protein
MPSPNGWVRRNARAHRAADPAPTSAPGLRTAVYTLRLQSVHASVHGTVVSTKWTRAALSCPGGRRAVDRVASADTRPAPSPRVAAAWQLAAPARPVRELDSSGISSRLLLPVAIDAPLWSSALRLPPPTSPKRPRPYRTFPSCQAALYTAQFTGPGAEAAFRSTEPPRTTSGSSYDPSNHQNRTLGEQGLLPALSGSSTTSSSPDSRHLHPCPRLDYIVEVKVFPGS